MAHSSGRVGVLDAFKDETGTLEISALQMAKLEIEGVQLAPSAAAMMRDHAGGNCGNHALTTLVA